MHAANAFSLPNHVSRFPPPSAPFRKFVALPPTRLIMSRIGVVKHRQVGRESVEFVPTKVAG